jgi:UDP-N-acetylmuramate--alanine ligase
MKTYHFIGLGGIGMSALARLLLQQGEKVQGSDLAMSSLLKELEQEGALIQIGHGVESMDEASVVVYSSAISETHVEMMRAKELKLPILHRSELLDQLMQGKKTLLVTGTHGKTTTSGLLAHVLSQAEFDPTFVVGGILAALQTNSRAGTGDYFVAESDESDGSFLKTAAFGAIVTNLENDHLDYWKDPENLDQAFAQFFSQVKNQKSLFWCADDVRLSALHPLGQSYGFSAAADWQIKEFSQTNQGARFHLMQGEKIYFAIETSLFGKHNALNAAAVFALAMSLGAKENLIRQGLNSFAGVLRRFEFKGEKHGVQVFDDYGHHPTEIAATLSALRGKIGQKRLVAVFQPHRYTRVRDLAEEFLHCFDEADEVVLTDIYSAGEEPIEGVTSAALYTRMRERLGGKLHFVSHANLDIGIAHMLMPHDVVMTIGAGDITQMGKPILDCFSQKAPKWVIGLVFDKNSFASAQLLFSGLDRTIYSVRLFGITEDGDWIEGEDCFEKIKHNIRLSFGVPKISPQVFQEILQCQIIFPLPQGIQGLFDVLKIPYADCNFLGCDSMAGDIDSLNSVQENCSLKLKEHCDRLAITALRVV